MEMNQVKETGSYLNITLLKARNGMMRYEIIKVVDTFFVLLFNNNGLKTAVVDHHTLIKMVQDDDNEFYFDKKDSKMVEALKKLNFDYENEEYIYEFELDLENGEILERDELE